MLILGKYFEVGGKMCRSPPSPPLISFFMQDFAGLSRHGSCSYEAFCPPPPSKHPGAAPVGMCCVWRVPPLAPAPPNYIQPQWRSRGGDGGGRPPKIGFFFFFFFFRRRKKGKKEREKGKCFPETFIRKRMKKEKEKGIGLCQGCQYINYP